MIEVMALKRDLAKARLRELVAGGEPDNDATWLLACQITERTFSGEAAAPFEAKLLAALALELSADRYQGLSPEQAAVEMNGSLRTPVALAGCAYAPNLVTADHIMKAPRG